MDELKIIEDSYFNQLNQIDIKKYVKKKAKFTYFPWADAHQLMKQYDPESRVEEREFIHHYVVPGTEENPVVVSKELPYQTTGNGSYVEVSVFFKGKEETEILPVLDFSNKDVPNPTMTQVNKALKRAFVKALGKHGLGLYIYRGEDLPYSPPIDLKELEQIEKILQKLSDLVKTDIEEITPELIKRTNQVIKMNFDYLEPISSLETMSKEQSGLFKRVMNESIQKAEAKKKEAEK